MHFGSAKVGWKIAEESSTTSVSSESSESYDAPIRRSRRIKKNTKAAKLFHSYPKDDGLLGDTKEEVPDKISVVPASNEQKLKQGPMFERGQELIDRIAVKKLMDKAKSLRLRDIPSEVKLFRKILKDHSVIFEL